MKAFAAVFSRECREWRPILVASLAGGLLPLGFSLIRAFGAPPADVRDSAAFFLAGIAGLLCALGLGFVVPGRGLSEGRMGFYFSRPISAWSIWSGRLAALYSITVLSVLAVLLPATLLGGGLLRLWEVAFFWDPSAPPWTGTRTWIFLAGSFAFLLFLLTAAQCASAIVRSGSPWMALDAFLGVGFAAAIGFSLWSLSSWPVRQILIVLVPLLFWAVLLSLLASGVAVTVRGRADMARAHRALSMTLWPCLAVVAAGTWTFSEWYVRPSFSSLRGVDYGIAAPVGSWMVVEGPSRWRMGDFEAAFLVNTRTLRATRLPAGTWSACFSGDGKVVASFESNRPGQEEEVLVHVLGSGEPVHHRTGITIGGGWSTLALSPDGNRIAVFNENSLTVNEWASGKILYARKEAEGTRMDGRFLTHGLLRVYRGPEWSGVAEGCPVDILDLDLETRTLRPLGVVENAGLYQVQSNASASRLLVRHKEGGAWKMSLHHGETGAPISVLADAVDGCVGTFASDGRIVLTTRRETTRKVSIFGSEGELEREIQLPPGERILAGEEFAPGRFTAFVRPGDERRRPEKGALRILDLATGRFDPVALGLRPFFSGGWYRRLSRIAPPPGSEATLIFSDPQGSLIRFDPATGQRRTIVKGTLTGDEGIR